MYFVDPKRCRFMTRPWKTSPEANQLAKTGSAKQASSLTSARYDLFQCLCFWICANLQLSLVQVFYVIVQFGGLLPESVRIQRRRLPEPDGGAVTEQPWQDWQYMARDCSVFEMQNNGPLLRPDSVNCLQLPRSVVCVRTCRKKNVLVTCCCCYGPYADIRRWKTLYSVQRTKQITPAIKRCVAVIGLQSSRSTYILFLV